MNCKYKLVFCVTVCFLTLKYGICVKEDWPPSCVTPSLNKTYNSKKGENSEIREVKYSGSIGPLGEKRICKIKCIDGQWVGPLCIDPEEDGRFQPLFRNCKMEYVHPSLLITFGNITFHNYTRLIYPHGSKLKIRCKEIGVYKLLGNASPKCNNGAWSSRLPSCVPTTMISNFSEDTPPSILTQIPTGFYSIEAGGEIAVYPGTTVHLECLFSRRLGSPDWTWTSPFGQYITGWAIASDERDYKFRLSIYYAKQQDTGTFTCTTPRGITNSIVVLVAPINCEPLPKTTISVHVEGTRLGQKAIFQCPKGYQIVGSSNLTCQISGKWSSVIPTCEQIKCPLESILEKTNDPHLKLEEQNNSFGGRVVFSCNWGYRLIGSPGVECEINGSWSGSPPRCELIECSSPVLSQERHLLHYEVSGMDGGRYTVGSLVKFWCTPLFTIVGESSIICTEYGIWSHPPPECKPIVNNTSN